MNKKVLFFIFLFSFSALNAESFFHQIMGVDEASFKLGFNKALSGGDSTTKNLDDLNIFLKKHDDGLFELTTPRGIFSCGRYEQLSIKALRSQLETRKNVKAMPGGGTFSVHKGSKLDVAVYQTAPENADTVFQVASNFNGLETCGPNEDINSRGLENYILDRTQGPAASISAAPGLIFRRNFLFYDPIKPAHEWQQSMVWSSGKKVDFLSAITENTSDNDRPTMSQAGYVSVKDAKRMPTDEDLENIEIAYHSDIDVTFGTGGDVFSKKPIIISREKRHKIDQVFAAAASNPGKNSPQKDWARCILNADYEGALVSAFLQGKKRVFLTLMGGGVFYNDFNDIFGAMHRMKDFIIESGMEVILIWRPRGDEPSGFCSNLKDFVIETKGVFIDNISGAKHDLPKAATSDPVVLGSGLGVPVKSAITLALEKLRGNLEALKSQLQSLAAKLTELKTGLPVKT